MKIQKRFYLPRHSGGAGGEGGGTDGGAGGSGSDDGGGGAGAGGDGADDKGEGDGGGDDDKPVARADHKRALDDLARFKNASKKANDELAALKKRFDDLERKGKGEDVETLKAQIREAEERNERLQGSVFKSERHRALLPALLEAGFKSDAKKILDHVDMDDLEVEVSTHGTFTVHGVEDFVKQMKKEYGFAFEPKKAKKVDAGGGGGGGGDGAVEWTPDKLNKLEDECRKKKDMAPYNKAIAEYMEQKKKKAANQ